MTDEILREMHAIKDANARRYRGGFAAMLRDLRKREEKSGRSIIRPPVLTKPTRNQTAAPRV